MDAPRKLYEILHARSKDYFQSGYCPKGEVHPCFIAVLFDDGNILIIDVDDVPKEKIANIHKATVDSVQSHVNVVASALVIEAWIKNVKSNAIDLDAIDLANDPNAEDAVMFDILTPSYQAVMLCKISPDRDDLEDAPFTILDPNMKHAGRFFVSRPPLH